MAILKQRIQLTPDDTIVAIVAIVEKKIWIPVTTVVAIMAILKNPGDINNCRNYGNFEDKKNIRIPFHHNCRNYGNFEDKKIYGSLFITIAAIMAILKKIQLTPDDSPDDSNCGKNKDESR